MTATLTFKRVLGVLNANSNSRLPGSPDLNGTISFALNEDDEEPVLRLNGAAWIKTKNLERYYALSFPGLTGDLFPVGVKFTDDGPDYVGAMGPNRELVIFGWKHLKRRGAWCISLEIFDRKQVTNVVGPILDDDCIGQRV